MIRIDLSARLAKGSKKLRDHFGIKLPSEDEFLESYWDNLRNGIKSYTCKYRRQPLSFSGKLEGSFQVVRQNLSERTSIRKFIEKIAAGLGSGSQTGLVKKLVIAKPDEISTLVKTVGEPPKVAVPVLNKIFNYKKNRTYQNRISEYFSLLEWYVCIYCGLNNVPQFEIQGKNGKLKLKRGYQLDHFYDKKTYPYLALSFYNMIPSCSFCNSRALKGNESIGEIIPWSDKYKFNDEVTFKLSDLGLLNQHGQPLQDAQILLKHDRNGDYARQIKVLLLENVYQVYVEKAAKLRAKVKKYSESQLKLMAKISGERLEELKQSIFEPLCHNDTSDTEPLSKLSSDIHTQLGIAPRPGISVRL